MSDIVIVDFGSQFTQLIARRIRECHVCSEVVSYRDLTNHHLVRARGIILSGGPSSVTENEAPKIPPCVWEKNCPLLGICYGMQAMIQTLGGAVQQTGVREFGRSDLQCLPSPLWSDLSLHQTVWMSHGDQVVTLPQKCRIIASSAHCACAAFEHEDRPYWGIQFHPEVTHTEHGSLLLEHFVRHICACPADWTMTNFLEKSVNSIRETVGKDRVILGLSGGVDSSVAAALIHRAIGQQLDALLIDHGFMRKNEVQDVMTAFASSGLTLHLCSAQKEFLSALSGVSDPEKKRRIIGHTFISCFEKEAHHFSAQWLAQGTIYSDVIESSCSSQSTQLIKSHHNVGGLPEKLRLKLLEPLRFLFKDEVRELGGVLGLPETLIHRHPFPGPGLAIRIIGEVTSSVILSLQEADAIFLEELHRTKHESGHSYYEELSQAFAVFLPVRSVGVMGDARTYEATICLRAVQTVDFMTAQWAPLPHSLLSQVAHRIINEVPGINRVVYDISNKPPATIEWE